MSISENKPNDKLFVTLENKYTMNFSSKRKYRKTNQNVELESLLYMLCVAKINCLLTYFYIHIAYVYPYSTLFFTNKNKTFPMLC